MRGRCLSRWLAALLAALALPAAAGAATVQSPSTGIAFSALAGEQNYVIVSPAATGIVRFVELGPELRAGFGCVQVDPRTVDCQARDRPAVIDLADTDDILEVTGGGIRVNARGGDGGDDLLAYGAGASTLDGGAGNDHLFGGLAADSISGGLGSDDLRGDVVSEGGDLRTSTTSGGDDLLIGGADTDSYEGGAGFDTISYADTPVPVTVVMPRPPEEGNTQTPGEGGQGEGMPPDVEGVIGSSGNDSLTGNRANNRLEGGPGNDTLTGNQGADLLAGGADGDTIFARDGQPDTISCGPNRTSRPPRSDTLDNDLVDGTPPADCETVTQGALNEGPNVRMSANRLRVRRNGRVAVRLSCPADLAIGCNGSLALRILPRSAPNGRAAARSDDYELAAGASAVVRLRLSRRERAALARRRRAARLTSVETGEFGPKTTIRTVRLRRAR
jgi:RTX calcium-binding nonapeptide repeat (4 copies)